MNRLLIASLAGALVTLGCNSEGGKESPDYRYLVEDGTAELPAGPPLDGQGEGTPGEGTDLQADICQPLCADNSCGSDGCGGTCGPCVGAQDLCQEGVCVCQPSCTGKECGGDGCGGDCGECEAPFHCEANKCECVPDCEGRECGYDGCFGECGTCPAPYSCDDGHCNCAYGSCSPEDTLDEVCSGTSLGNCGYWACSETGCCTVAQVEAPDCCQGNDDCRDCINLATAEVVPCPQTIPDDFVTHKCTQDVCGLNNQCKHFDKVVFGECNDDDPCTTDSCAPSSGVCTHAPIPDCEQPT